MSQARESTPMAACPRRRSAKTAMQSTSPVAGLSTEPEENTNPDRYPAAFRLKPEELANLPVAPSIPALRRPSGG